MEDEDEGENIESPTIEKKNTNNNSIMPGSMQPMIQH
jgi:hypothetical protein